MGKLKEKVPLVDYIAITVGSLLLALGIGVFLVDAKVVPGGASGLAMAIHYLSGNRIPVGLLIWLINVPLYIWGIKELGKLFGIRTFYGFTVSSFFIDFFRGDVPGFSFIHLQDSEAVRNLMNNDFLFLIIISGTLIGVGVGIIFKFKGTTAGSDIVAAIMQKHYGIKPGQAIMITDFLIITFAGLVIHFENLSPEKSAIILTFYAFFLLFISTRIIDVIIDGFDYARMATIISEKSEEIAKTIIHDFSRGATALKSRGLYKNIEREVIVTVVTLKEVGRLTETIKKIDPDAFVVIHNVHEVLGEGFRRRI
jgi:uncharacterized membrane-anchored protein YitT (DUF2179 family)